LYVTVLERDSGVVWGTFSGVVCLPFCPGDTRFLRTPFPRQHNSTLRSLARAVPLLGAQSLAPVPDGTERKLLRLPCDEAVRLSRRSSDHSLLRPPHPCSERNPAGRKTADAAPAAGGGLAAGGSAHVPSPLGQLGAFGPLHSHARRSRRERV